MTLATVHFKLRLRRKRRTLLPKLQPPWWMECCKSIKNSTCRIPRWNSARRPCIIYSTSFLARIALREAHLAHSAILENIRQQFMQLSLQHRGGFRNYNWLLPSTHYPVLLGHKNTRHKRKDIKILFAGKYFTFLCFLFLLFHQSVFLLLFILFKLFFQFSFFIFFIFLKSSIDKLLKSTEFMLLLYA